MATVLSTIKGTLEAFALFDKKGTGYVTSQDLGLVMRALGMRPSDDELEAMIRDCGSSKKHLDFDDFVGVMTQVYDEEQTSAQFESTFQTFDRDGDGYIGWEDLSKVMENVGEDLTKEELCDMINQAHTKREGKMDFEEFVILMMSL